MLIVVLGLALYGVVAGLGHWASSEDDDVQGYSTERMVEAAYHAPARTAYTPSAAGNSAVAVPMSASRGTLFRHTYVPAANYTVSTPMLSGGAYAAQGLMLTSQQRPQSYGGSGSATGTSARTSSGSTGSGSTGGSSYAMGGYASSGSALGGTYTYSTSAGGGISVNGNMTSTFSPSVYASAPAPYASFNNDFGAWGNAYNPLDGGISAIDDQTPFGGILAGVQRRAAAGNIQQTWYNWLQRWYVNGGNGNGNGNWSEEDGTYYFTEQQIEDAYYAWLATQSQGAGEAYTLEQWKSWFYGLSSGTYQYRSPVGDYYPLLFLAWGYILYVAYRKRRSARIV